MKKRTSEEEMWIAILTNQFLGPHFETMKELQYKVYGYADDGKLLGPFFSRGMTKKAVDRYNKQLIKSRINSEVEASYKI